jgi:GNAT superfamily N-acetyltransferase
MIPLAPPSDYDVYRLLVQQEPWHMIPLDALLLYGLEHPEHQWYGEYKNGQLVGVLYQHGQLLHFAYHQVPENGSPLYPFIRRYIPYFITHGKKDKVDGIMRNLNEYQITLQEECEFIQQTSQTRKLISQSLFQPDNLRLCQAYPSDFNEMIILFRGSTIENQVDRALIFELIGLQRVTVARKNGRMVGTVMKLKETPCYVLLGGLFVHPQERGHGTASLLGQKMIQDCLHQGKKVCFYYSDPELQRFYRKAAFAGIGQWVSYSATSKAIT